MTDWVNIELDSIMKDSNDHLGHLVRGLEFYFMKLLKQNEMLIHLLADCQNDLYWIKKNLDKEENPP